MQAITVKMLSPTDTKGSRVKATAAAGSVTLPRDYALTDSRNAYRAAIALADKYEWLPATNPNTPWSLDGGQMANGDYVFVLLCAGQPTHGL